MDPLISVIIPVYNCEKYLPECVDSVLGQTYGNLEIILVDDGSTDKSPSICDEYARQDRRVKVIHKKHGGSSDTRNVGLDVIMGEYVTFVDSDDWIALDMLETLYKAQNRYNTDIVSCSHYKVYENITIPPVEFSPTDLMMTGEQTANMVLTAKLSSIVWEKLYKKEIFNTVRFPVGIIYDDIATAFEIYINADKVIFIPIPLYYWRRRKSSQSKKANNTENILLQLEAHEERHDRITKKYPAFISTSEDALLKKYKETVKALTEQPYNSSYKNLQNTKNRIISLLSKIEAISTQKRHDVYFTRKEMMKIYIITKSPRLFWFTLSAKTGLKRILSLFCRKSEIKQDENVMFE